MGWDSFSRHFPITFSHLDNFVRGMPHEKFAIKGSKTGKKACRWLVLKKTVRCPVSIPLLTSFSYLLTAIKLIEVSGRLFTLLHPTKNHIHHFILASKQATDYLMLSFIIPVKIVAEICKISVAMFFGSHLYFSHPKTYPLPVQMDYYQKNADRLFYQFRFARNLTLQMKAEVHEIEQVHEKIIAELTDIEEGIKFLKQIIKFIKKLDPAKIHTKNLDVLREFCQDTAEEHKIKIAFKTPQKDLTTITGNSNTTTSQYFSFISQEAKL